MDRRGFLKGSAMAAGAVVSVPLMGAQGPTENLPFETGKPLPIKLGLASYTFRSFDRAKVIEWMKQLHLTDINCKDVKDHLPMDPAKEDAALADYKANGITVRAAGTVYFPKDEDDDIRTKFEYAKRAGIKVIVSGDPTVETLPRIEKFV